MQNSIEKTGKSIEEAVKMALEELNAREEDVEIEILDEGNRGLLGIIGNKMAKVKVSRKNEYGEKARAYIEGIIRRMGIQAQVEIEENSNTVLAKLEGNNVGVLIGKRGTTLDALQYLTNLSVNRGNETYKKIVIDSENYRKKREETLERLANRLADQVIKYKKSITLEPMTPYERRIIHSSLQGNSHVKTYSVGDEPNRKIIIALK